MNLDDPVSVAVGAYYQTKRNIPPANVISVHIPTGTTTITSAQFATVSTAVAAALPPGIEAYALTFTQPYDVQGMSITSAFAFGFDTKWTNTLGGCQATAESPYYATDDQKPFEDLAMRPAMMLAGSTQADVLALIDRGVASDDTHPKGTDYMLITTDPARSVRAYEFEELAEMWDPATGVTADVIDNTDGGGLDYITGKTDVLFYFTGLASVPDITMNTYIPGAMADHLTSYGGQVPTSGQMSAAAWLAAGATASFGTVVEPCNFTEKFPDPSITVPRYYQGATAMEAYWKSVEWPGEGLFIGEPLANPWKSPVVTFSGDVFTIETTALDPTVQYALEGANAESGPFTTVQTGISVAKYDVAKVTVHAPTYAFYRLVPAAAGDE